MLVLDNVFVVFFFLFILLIWCLLYVCAFVSTLSTRHVNVHITLTTQTRARAPLSSLALFMRRPMSMRERLVFRLCV